ncbi:hypothetical protein BV210_05120 [Halorientalis sp. IM1011]|nr:hypothetical protein BV210_05120 [Halorientalis sp. IM1011]
MFLDRWHYSLITQLRYSTPFREQHYVLIIYIYIQIPIIRKINTLFSNDRGVIKQVCLSTFVSSRVI